MRLRFTVHALEQMLERDISRDEVADVITHPQRTSEGETAIDY